MRFPLVLCVLALLLSVGAVEPAAGTSGEAGPGITAAVYGSGRSGAGDAGTVLAANVGAAAATSDIVVTYIGVPAQAQAAFDHAVAIWETIVVSQVPITVEVRWEAGLPASLWGRAGFENTYRNFPGAPMADTWYPIPIANALAGEDLLADRPDITATFNSGTNWYFGLDGAPAADQADFVTLALHELAHGLGFGASFSKSGLLGKWRAEMDSPFIYDRYVENGAGQLLINTAIFENPSIPLGDELSGGDLWFSGPEAVAAAGGTRPRLYSPNPYQELSAVQHLDEATYPRGDANALMTPFFDTGEAVHAPGPIAVGMLRDLGWETSNHVCRALEAGSLGAGVATVSPGNSLGCTPGTFVPGDVITLVGTADPGWTLTQWTTSAGPPACTACGSTAFVMPDAAVTVVARFEQLALGQRLAVPGLARGAGP